MFFCLCLLHHNTTKWHKYCILLFTILHLFSGETLLLASRSSLWPPACHSLPQHPSTTRTATTTTTAGPVVSKRSSTHLSLPQPQLQRHSSLFSTPFLSLLLIPRFFFINCMSHLTLCSTRSNQLAHEERLKVHFLSGCNDIMWSNPLVERTRMFQDKKRKKEMKACFASHATLSLLNLCLNFCSKMQKVNKLWWVSSACATFALYGTS